MANTLGIIECTLADLASKASLVNTLGTTGLDISTNPRTTAQPHDTVTVRVTDAGLPLNTGTGTDVANMALYVSKTHLGEWVRGDYNDGTRYLYNVVTPV